MSDSTALVGRVQPFRAVSYPWRLYCGTDALDNLPVEVARHGARRAFVICGRTVAHRTNLYDHVGQGEATSAVTPTVLRRLGGARGAGGRRMAEALDVATEGMAPETAGGAAADALATFYRDIGMPARVRDLGIPEAELPLLARDTLKNFNANRGARPADYVDQMLELLQACW